MRIVYLKRFLKDYSKLPEEIKKQAEKKEALFRKNLFEPILDTHRLHGALSEFYGFSINNKYRIVFSFIQDNLVQFHRVGTHDVYK